MEITRITSVEDPLFKPVWDIYRASFPIYEQRTPEHQRTAFRRNIYHLDGYTDKGRVIGFLGYWDFPDYLYIEHFAVDPASRNGGYGGKILSGLIARTSKTILIEIDPPTDGISTRRYNFYARHGFRMTPYKYPLDQYQPDNHKDKFFSIMTYPEAIDKEAYERFNEDMRLVVMKRDEERNCGQKSGVKRDLERV